MPRVTISDALAARARKNLERAVDDPDYAKAHWQQVTMSEKVLRLYEVQNKYGADVDRRAGLPKSSSDIRELAAMSTDDLLALQKKMLGKPLPS
jgi:hypothetical protein